MIRKNNHKLFLEIIMLNVKENIINQAKKQGAQITHLREQVLDIILTLPKGVIKAYHVLAQMQQHSNTNIAPPTAYRALDFWVEQGVLHKIAAVNGYILCHHTQHECNSHCHAENNSHTAFILVCTKCGTVNEQTLNHEWTALKQAVQQKGFALTEEHLVLTGVCAQCQ